jgi:hypothetical protein
VAGRPRSRCRTRSRSAESGVARSASILILSLPGRCAIIAAAGCRVHGQSSSSAPTSSGDDWRRRRAPGSSALDLGPSACAALIQEPDDQERLDASTPTALSTVPLYSLPQARSAIAHDAARRQPALRDAPSLVTRASRRSVDRELAAVCDAARRRAVQESNGHVAVRRLKLVDISDPPTTPSAEVDALRPNSGALAVALEVGEHSLVRIRRSCRVRAERDIVDRRVGGRSRSAADLRKGQLVEPDKCQRS